MWILADLTWLQRDNSVAMRATFLQREYSSCIVMESLMAWFISVEGKVELAHRLPVSIGRMSVSKLS